MKEWQDGVGEKTYVVVFEVRAQDAPAEFTDVRDDERSPMFCPRNEVC